VLALHGITVTEMMIHAMEAAERRTDRNMLITIGFDSIMYILTQKFKSCLGN